MFNQITYIDEMFNYLTKQYEQMDSIFEFPFFARYFKYTTVNFGNSLTVFMCHCPRVEVTNNVDNNEILLIKNYSKFDVGSDKGEIIAVYNPKKVEMIFRGEDLYAPNRVIFNNKEN